MTRDTHDTRAASLAARLGALVFCVACATEPTAVLAGDPGRGQAAFVASCAGCHTTRDAFDIAHFGFASSDIVRRALSHVDRQTAEDIAAYVHSLGIPAVGRDTRPFQPGTRILGGDAAFWQAAFGTAGWPADITAEAIRALDPRVLDAPVGLPRWSSEADDSDWLPASPLPLEVLDADNGALAAALGVYYADPTTAGLLTAVAVFQSVSGDGIHSPCYGEAATHTRPRDCFEARRWMSTLAAQHFLRPGASAVPVEVAELWWSTGQAAVTLYLEESGHPRSMVWGWLYLAYTFAPTRFNEDNGYLGQFLQSDGLPHLAAFTALRRLVDSAEVHRGLPGQRFWDTAQAISRAPAGLKADIAEFSFEFLDRWLVSHAPLPEGERETAAIFLDFAYASLLQSAVDPAQLQRITQARDRLLDELR